MANSTIAGSPLQAVPRLLRSLDRWIVHRNKKPVDEQWADHSHWLSFDDAVAQVDPDDKATGVGFLTTDGVKIGDLTLLVFDLDACRDPQTGNIEPWAQQVVENCGNGYAEITPSGRGLRAFALVETPPERWGAVSSAAD